ncbi:MAG TPA: enoyl-CoA hydratase/isomerase family protein [Vicinamibacterales bacterium]|nr:enoyl-CoA hydratase/isomerase family protein [Vicinamibacterales bacterium]
MIGVERRLDGGHLRLVLDDPPGNVLTIALMRELRGALVGIESGRPLRLVTIEGAGDHFSYGASVDEHRADRIAGALAELHGLVRDLFACPAPTAAVVRGRCLGGGLEVALGCDLVFAADTAVLGVPEISLGVFPPAASALLPLRVGPSRAASAILTGRALSAADWAAAGLVEMVAPAAELPAAVDRWFAGHLASKSAAALGLAAAASRAALSRAFEDAIPGLERLYLDRLMRTHDASEGIEAFLARRPPRWTDA